MRACDEKLKSCLLEAVGQDIARRKEEAQNSEPFVCSADFERRMAELMQVHKRKSARRKVLRYAAAAIVALLLTGGILFMKTENLRASDVSIGILDWLENFFTVDEGEDFRKDDGVLFEESQIGYLPEGFEKSEEYVSFSQVYYKYENVAKEYFIIQVFRDKTATGIDNEKIEQEVHLNEVGLEYRFIGKDKQETTAIIWEDKEGVYYYLISTLEEMEVLNIMNGISYLEE